MLKILFITLLIILPLITSHLLYFLGFNDNRFIVSGNFEFTKVIFFNIYSTILLIVGFFYIIKNKDLLNKINIFKKNHYIYLFFLIGILIISSIFGLSPETSFFGNTNKGHSSIMFINLIGLFLLLPIIIDDKNTKIQILNIILFTTAILSLIGIKEYFYPSLNYGNLGNRLLSTLGHPNYIAGIIILILPYAIYNIRKKINILSIFLLLIISIGFLLTKSIIPLGLFMLFLGLYFYFQITFKYKKLLTFIFIILGLLIIFIISYKFGITTKLSSFISRFFIWKTTINIIFDNIKGIFLGNGLDTLDIIFNKYKSIELYIFENIGFGADRPHNLILNSFYHLGIIGLILIILLYIKIFLKIKDITKDNFFIISGLLMVLIFLLFNFSTITLYLYILIFIYILFFFKDRNSIGNRYSNTKYIYIYIYILILIISVIGSIYSTFSYNKEVLKYKGQDINNSIVLNYKDLMSLGKYNEGLKKINIIPEIYYFFKLKEYTLNKDINNINIFCSELIKNYNTVENNFYCGDIYNYLKKEKETKYYYSRGISLLPNLWVSNNIYQNKKWYKNAFTTHRFFHEKFGIIQKLNYLNINITNQKKEFIK